MAHDIEDPSFIVKKIGGGYYRKLIVPEKMPFKQNLHYDVYEEEEVRELDDQMTYEGDEWSLKLPIQAVFHKFICGSRGKNKQKLEMESGARILIPHREEQQDAIWLKARLKQQIYSCKAQVELLCEREESKLEYTHFLSIPLSHDAKFRSRVDDFREDVVLNRFEGIEASMFMPSKRMHFTVCMLKLHSHAQVDEMKTALQDVSERISAAPDFNRPLSARMKGVHIMTDDPSSVSVVFTTDRSHALQNRVNNLSDSIFELLKARGLLTQQNLVAQRLLSSDGAHAEVKLHATLVNTKYGRQGRREDGSRFAGNERETFDASGLMEKLGHVDFGEVPMKEIQLSCLDEMGDDGYYRSLTSVPLHKAK